MEEKLNKLIHIKGTPNKEAKEIINLAKNIIGKENTINYLRFLIAVQDKMYQRNIPRMIEPDADEIFQDILSSLFEIFKKEYQ